MNPAPKPQKREKKQKKHLRPRRDGIEKECDELWRDCVYLRANFRSEQSGIRADISDGKVAGINAHHICKKSNYWLRYSLDNGICLLESEHEEHHFEASPAIFERRMISLVGPQRWEKLLELKRDTTKANINAIREDLRFTRATLIERVRRTGDESILNAYLKQRGL